MTWIETIGACLIAWAVLALLCCWVTGDLRSWFGAE